MTLWILIVLVAAAPPPFAGDVGPASPRVTIQAVTRDQCLTASIVLNTVSGVEARCVGPRGEMARVERREAN